MALRYLARRMRIPAAVRPPSGPRRMAPSAGSPSRTTRTPQGKMGSSTSLTEENKYVDEELRSLFEQARRRREERERFDKLYMRSMVLSVAAAYATGALCLSYLFNGLRAR